MKHPSRPSFRYQLLGRYVASFGLLLLLLGAITWFNVHHCLVESLDRGMLVIARSEGEFATQNGKLHLHHTSNVQPNSDAASLPRYVQITDPSGKVLVSNHAPLPEPLPLDAASLRSAEPLFVTVPYAGSRYRMLYLPLRMEGRQLSFQVATPLAPTYDTLRQVMGIYALSSLLMLALAGWLGWRLAERAVAPIDRISLIADRISLQHLSERIASAPETPRELQRLIDMLNQMLARLESSAQTLQQFTADAAHELRTPLSILKGEIQVALRRSRPAEEYRELLESNLEEVERLIQLAEALLTLSRFDQQSTTGKLLKGSCELNDLIQMMAERWREAVQQEGVGLEVLPAEQWVQVGVQETYLEQVLHNLIDNALRISPPGTSLKLGVEAVGKEAILWVSDQGPGIAPEYQQRIFERFFQLDSARTGNRNHFGIGLSLSQAIVEAHGGRIDVESAPGQGSTFRVRLPLLAQNAGKASKHVLAQGPGSQTGADS